MPLMGITEATVKLNELRDDFAARSESLVHAINTDQKIHSMISDDKMKLKQELEKIEHDVATDVRTRIVDSAK